MRLFVQEVVIVCKRREEVSLNWAKWFLYARFLDVFYWFSNFNASLSTEFYLLGARNTLIPAKAVIRMSNRGTHSII